MVRSVWHRTLLLMIGACAVALMATLHGHPGSTTAAASPSRIASSPVSAAVPECRSTDLSADYRARDAAAGHRYGVIRLRNTSSRACVVQGYGGLSYVGGGDGTAVGAPADREPGTAPRVVLAPGDRARSLVTETVAQDYPRSACRPTGVDAFLVYPPDATRPFFVKHRTTGCLDESVHLISHRPFRG